MMRGSSKFKRMGTQLSLLRTDFSLHWDATAELKGFLKFEPVDSTDITQANPPNYYSGV
jgi:hypothetical protein